MGRKDKDDGFWWEGSSNVPRGWLSGRARRAPRGQEHSGTNPRGFGRSLFRAGQFLDGARPARWLVFREGQVSAINEEDWRQLFYAMDANLAALRALRKTLEESSDRQAEQIRQALQTLASLEEHDAPSFQAELLDAREARCAALPPNHKAWECE